LRAGGAGFGALLAGLLEIRPGTITLEFLEAIPPGLRRKDFMPLLQQRIEDATAGASNEAVNRLRI
jgi:hypothetical protein